MNKKFIVSILFCILFACLLAACTSNVETKAEQAANIQEAATQEPVPGVTATFSTDTSAVTCADAEGYARDGEYDLARSSYTSIATTTPGAKCALQGLIMVDEMEKEEETPPESTPGYEDIVPALLNNGDYAGAWDKLKEGVAANPSSTSKSNFWLWLWKAWNYLKNLTIDILIPLAMAIFIILLIFPLVKIINPFKRRIIIDIADFKPGSASEVDEKMCLSVTAKVEENLFNYYKERLMDGARIITSAVDPPDLPDSISSKASGIWNFLVKLYPTRIFSVSGILEYHKEKGVGLALTASFTNNQKILGHITLWEKEQNIPVRESEKSSLLNKILAPKKSKTEEPPQAFNKDDYYARVRTLAMVASAWVFWQYCLLDENNQLKSIFGTKIFESYKWYLLFLYQLQIMTGMTLEKKQEKAKPYLLKALAADRCNTVSLLAFCQYYLDPKKKPENRELFEKTMQQIIDHGKETDLTSILAHYWLGDLYSSEILKIHGTIPQIDKNDRKKFFEGHFKPAYEGVQIATGITEDLRRMVQIPYLLSIILSGDLNVAKRELFKIEEMRSENANLMYNLACFYATLDTFVPEMIELSNELVENFYPDLTFVKTVETIKFNEMAMVNLEKAVFHSNFGNQEKADEYFKYWEDDQWLKNLLKECPEKYQNIKTDVTKMIKVFSDNENTQKSK